MRVLVNPQALAAYGLNLDDLRTTISVANQNGPKGTFDGPTRAYTINANDQLRSADEYGKIVIAYRNGAAVRLSDVATLVAGRREHQARRLDEQHAGADHQRAAPAERQRRRRGRQHQETAARAAGLAARRASRSQVLTDRTTTIRASIRDVQFELALAVALVVLVIFLFLRNVPATIIPACRCRCR